MKILFTEVENATRVVLKEGAVTHLEHTPEGSILVIGYDKKTLSTPTAGIRLVRSIVRAGIAQKISNLSLDLKDFGFSKHLGQRNDFGVVLGREFQLAAYEFKDYKTGDKDEYSGLESISILNTSASKQRDIRTGEIIGEGINWGRTVANTPANHMTPQLFFEEAEQYVGNSVAIRKATSQETEKMGLFNGVAQGSIHPSAFVIAEYWGASKKIAPTVLVGKGVTFDTGGLSLKPANGMLGMHLDMSGAALAIATIGVIAKLKSKKNVVVLAPMVENAVGHNATRPGDILTSLSGKTVDILNTDAEGRLILADALTFAKNYEPAAVVSIATLTGAIVVALGKRTSGLFTPSDSFAKTLTAIGDKSGNRIWRLPLWSEYSSDIKGERADLVNISNKPNSRDGGAIVAAAFLNDFVDGAYKYAHIDMASRDESIPEDNLAPLSSGEPASLLVDWLK